VHFNLFQNIEVSKKNLCFIFLCMIVAFAMIKLTTIDILVIRNNFMYSVKRGLLSIINDGKEPHENLSDHLVA